MKLNGNKRKRVQFSKKMCVVSWVLMAGTAIACIAGEFLLQWTARGSMINVVEIALGLISFVTVFINGGYLTQNVFRDTSANKHGIHVPGDGKDKHYIEPPKGGGI